MSALAPEVAQVLDDRYRLEGCIGEGGMARVFRAEDLMLGRTVAVKLMRPGLAGGSAETARSEMAVLASLNHPSLVTLLDASLARDNQPYLVMEYVDGPTLANRLAGGALPPRDVGEIAVELAEALHVVHAAGIVHRDVKPSNVLLCPPEFPGARLHSKLADFGIAYLLADADATAPNEVVGTAAYLAPEQLRGAAPAPAADIYALGLVLLEALTGRRPFPHAGGIAAAIARLNAPLEIPETVGADWRHLLGRMLQIEPAMRPTALDVAQAAKALCLRLRPTGAPVTESLESALGFVDVDEAETPSGGDGDDSITRPLPVIGATSGAHVARRSVRGRRASAFVAGGLAAAAVTVAAVFGVGAMTTADTGPGPSSPSVVEQEPPPIIAEDAVDETVTDAVDAEPAETPVDSAGVEPAGAVEPAAEVALTDEQRKAAHEQHVQEARDRGAQGKGQDNGGPGKQK